MAAASLIVGLERVRSTSAASGDQHGLLQILAFFTKAGTTLPTGGHLEQSDGTSWMAMYCLNMLAMAMEIREAA